MQITLSQKYSIASCKKEFQKFMDDVNHPNLSSAFAGILPEPQLTGWVEGSKRNNCFNYAINFKAGRPLMPGEIHREINGADMISFDNEKRRLTRRKGVFDEFYKSVVGDMKKDGFIELGHKLDAKNVQQPIIALFLREESIHNDFHFYSLRFDEEKQRVVVCHKLNARKEPEELSASTSMFDNAQENSYQHFAGFWGVDKDAIRFASLDEWGDHSPTWL